MATAPRAVAAVDEPQQEETKVGLTLPGAERTLFWALPMAICWAATQPCLVWPEPEGQPGAVAHPSTSAWHAAFTEEEEAGPNDTAAARL